MWVRKMSQSVYVDFVKVQVRSDLKRLRMLYKKVWVIIFYSLMKSVMIVINIFQTVLKLLCLDF